MWMSFIWMQTGSGDHARNAKRGRGGVGKHCTDIHNPIIVLHFINHPLRSQLMYMDNTTCPHRMRAGLEFL